MNPGGSNLCRYRILDGLRLPVQFIPAYFGHRRNENSSSTMALRVPLTWSPRRPRAA